MNNFLVIGGTGVMGTAAIKAVRENFGGTANIRTAVTIDIAKSCVMRSAGSIPVGKHVPLPRFGLTRIGWDLLPGE